MKSFIIPGLLLLFFLYLNPYCYPQEKLSGAEQKVIIDSLCLKLQKLYPVEETGNRASSAILKKYKDGDYSAYTLLPGFIQQLNTDLETLAKDGHLGIIYDSVMAAELKNNINDTSQEKSYADIEAETERWNNYGFKELKILQGNIGYVDLRLFFSLKYAGETAAAAMNFFANCNALIIDLRRNGGGWDEMVTFLAGYFLQNTSDIIFNITHSKLDGSYFASVPANYVPGKKLTGIPIVILTSRSTASAAEAFTDIMKHFSKNTTVIGETTAGAENPVEEVPLYDGYILRIPVWQKIYSYDKIGWEGKGIEPDIHAASDSAFNNAHLYLLNKLKSDAADQTIKNKYQWYIEGVNAVKKPVSVPESILKSYIGKYGNRDISYENGNLYYQYKGRAKRKMIPISKDYFAIEENDTRRVKFIKEKDVVAGMNEITEDGNNTKLTKTP